MICPNCGAENTEESNFCSRCGAALRPARGCFPARLWRGEYHLWLMVCLFCFFHTMLSFFFGFLIYLKSYAAIALGVPWALFQILMLVGIWRASKRFRGNLFMKYFAFFVTLTCLWINTGEMALGLRSKLPF